MRLPALIWLAIVLAAAGYLAARLHAGIELHTDLLALLPQEEREPDVQRAKARMSEAFGRRIVLLVGHEDRLVVRAAGETLAIALQESGQAQSVIYQIRGDALRDTADLLFPYRFGLLTRDDRQRLEDGRGQDIVARTLASLYGPVAVVNAKLLQQDPFLLLPTYLAALPTPLPATSVDQGVITVVDGGMTYVMVTATLHGDAAALAAQNHVVDLLNATADGLRAQAPGLRVLRAGPLFYAQASAAVATSETKLIGLSSAIGTAILIFAVFRALRPLWLSLLAIAVGILSATAACLWMFGTIHVGAMLFGISLIGIAVDYSLHYACEGLGEIATPPRARMKRVLPGIALGLMTTLIGYLTLLLAPFPGLHQLAVFSAVGLVGSFLTVVLWVPLLDADHPSQRAQSLLTMAGGLWQFWRDTRYRSIQIAVAVIGLSAALAGMARFTLDDDVRRLQALPADLVTQEAEIRRLTGAGSGTQFFLVRGRDMESVLETEEKLIDRLEAAKSRHELRRFQSVAQIVPSIARQRENRALVRERLLDPFLAGFQAQLGIAGAPKQTADAFLTPAAIGGIPALSFLRDLTIENGSNGAADIILLDGVADVDAVRHLGDGLGVRLIDPTADFSRLLGQYRWRAVVLLVLSAALMLPVLMWRYGPWPGLRVLLPAAIAVILTPFLVALNGAPFTFFNAIALVLVLSIGIDYAIFCKETESKRKSSTMLGIWLATVTTIMSFGLLSLSSVHAVHAFGLTLTVGISLAFFLSPLAGEKRPATGSVMASAPAHR